MKILYWMCKF